MTIDPRPQVQQQLYGYGGYGVPVTVRTSQAISAGASAFGRRYPMLVEFLPGHAMPLHPVAENRFSLPPGRYRASFYTLYVFIRVGKAELTFDTSSGEPVTLWYSAPYTIHSKGVASFSPQERRPGIRVLAGSYAVCIAIVLAGLLMGLISSLNG
jgi:hypothetical protein